MDNGEGQPRWTTTKANRDGQRLRLTAVYNDDGQSIIAMSKSGELNTPSQTQRRRLIGDVMII